MLNTLRRERIPFFRFAMNQSSGHRGFFQERPLGAERRTQLTVMSEESLVEQARVEAADQENFDHYLARFLALDIP